MTDFCQNIKQNKKKEVKKVKNFHSDVNKLQLALTVKYGKKYAINTSQYYNTKYKRWATIYTVEEEVFVKDKDGKEKKKTNVVVETYKFRDVFTFFIETWEKLREEGEG